MSFSGEGEQEEVEDHTHGEQVFEELECPLSMKLLLDPVTLPCGHTFSRGPLAQSLELQAACPLCREPLFATAQDLATNYTIAAVLENRFPKQLAERRAEAAQDGEAAWGGEVAALERTLPLAFIPTMLPSSSFDDPIISEESGDDGMAGDADQLQAPFLPVTLVLFEPRYLMMLEQIMHSGSRRFGLQPSRESPIGTVVRVQSSTRLVDGRVLIKAEAESRYERVSDPDEGALGLAQCRVRLFEEPLLPALPHERAPADSSPTEASLRRELQVLRSTLAAEAMRWTSEAGPECVQALQQRFGELPSSPSALSFYLASVLALPSVVRRRCMCQPIAIHRMRLLYRWLAAREAATAAEPAQDGEQQPAPRPVAELHLERAEEEPLDPDSVRPFPSLHTSTVLWLAEERQRAASGRSYLFTPSGRIRELADQMQPSSTVQSLLLLVAIFVALWFFANRR